MGDGIELATKRQADLVRSRDVVLLKNINHRLREKSLSRRFEDPDLHRVEAVPNSVSMDKDSSPVVEHTSQINEKRMEVNLERHRFIVG